MLRIEAAQRVAGKIIGCGETAPPPDRPGHRRHIERQGLFDLIQEIEGIARLAVHLVDERDDRNVAQAADLEQFAGACLDALGRIDHHDRRIDGGQRAVGILGKVGMARRVEEIEDIAPIFEGHHRGDDGNAALALDRHPVGAGGDAVLLGLDFARELDRATEQQEFLGQGGLAGVRMRDDRESAPSCHLGRCGGCLHDIHDFGLCFGGSLAPQSCHVIKDHCSAT